MAELRSVAIVGAGAMGCFFAARLAEAGLDVTVVDVDGPRLEAMARDGITLSDDQGERTIKVGAAKAGDMKGPVDLIILYTKGMHSAAAVASVKHLAGPNTWAMTAQNGLGNAEIMASVFPPDRVIVGATGLPADLHGATHVSSHGAGQVWLNGYTPAADAGAEPVAAALRKGGIDAVVDPNVQVSIWEKVAFNAALNALGAITLLPNGAVDTPEGREIAFGVMDEVVAVAHAKKIPIDASHISEKINFALANHRAHKASMLQDRLAGRRTEIEQINGAIVREGKAANVPTPVNATLANLMRLIDANPPKA